MEPMKNYFVMLCALIIMIQADVQANYQDCDESSYKRHKMTCKEYTFNPVSVRICTFHCKEEYLPTVVPISICKGGKMDRDMPCGLRESLVNQCDQTNMEDCPYSIEDIVEYLEAKFQEEENELTEEEIDELDKTPSIPGGFIECEVFNCFILTTVGPGIGRTRNRVQCKDKKTGQEFCKRNLTTGEHVFNCPDFLRRKINKKLAIKKMKACYECRVKSCSGSVRVF